MTDKQGRNKCQQIQGRIKGESKNRSENMGALNLGGAVHTTRPSNREAAVRLSWHF